MEEDNQNGARNGKQAMVFRWTGSEIFPGGKHHQVLLPTVCGQRSSGMPIKQPMGIYLQWLKLEFLVIYSCSIIVSCLELSCSTDFNSRLTTETECQKAQSKHELLLRTLSKFIVVIIILLTICPIVFYKVITVDICILFSDGFTSIDPIAVYINGLRK
ncbi:GQ67_01477T0 [Komagataella phaffii]|nr:GQ67_01477T0 [Komagataella phaffii]AOA66846.1 GQ68_01493T0 [Komagataella phaffii GS115]